MTRCIPLLLLLSSFAFSQVALSKQLKVDGLGLGSQPQTVIKMWGKPAKRIVHTTPSSEDWSYPQGGAILEQSPKGVLVVKLVAGHTLTGTGNLKLARGD